MNFPKLSSLVFKSRLSCYANSPLRNRDPFS